MAPIVNIWTDRFSWYFWQRFSRFLVCAGTPPGACRWVIIDGLYPWHAPCFWNRRHTSVTAASPVTHWSVLCAAGLLLLLLAHLAWVTGRRGVETSTRVMLTVSNCSTLTVTDVRCGPLLIGYRQRLIAWHQRRRERKWSYTEDMWKWLIGQSPTYKCNWDLHTKCMRNTTADAQYFRSNQMTVMINLPQVLFSVCLLWNINCICCTVPITCMTIYKWAY